VRRWRAAFVSCFSLAFIAACAASESQPMAATMLVEGAWSRTADSGATTALYFTLLNESITDDTLTGVITTDAATAEMHISTRHGSTMHMSPIRTLAVPASDSVEFRPLGAHVMLVGLKRPLVEGDSVRVDLTFVSGRTVSVVASVRKP
jgi:copper(I)-binding protein